MHTRLLYTKAINHSKKKKDFKFVPYGFLHQAKKLFWLLVYNLNFPSYAGEISFRKVKIRASGHEAQTDVPKLPHFSS